MSEARSSERPVGRFAMRTIALIVGLIGSVLALAVTILYSVAHVLTQIAGMSQDSAHFFSGLFVVLLAAVGSFLAPIIPILSAAMLAVAGIALFFIVGWWACFVSPFLFVAAGLTFSNRRVDIPGTG